MLNYNISGIKINIELPNGIYVFSRESGSGKTRLFKLLVELRECGENITTYTYSDKTLYRVDLHSLLENNISELIMLDRYDMYIGECAKEIEALGKDRVILIDCKQTDINIDYDSLCGIELGKNEVTVEL